MSEKAMKYLLKELSTEFGIIDFTQPVQTAYLFNLMQDLEVPVDLIQETITRLVEKDEATPLDDKEKERAEKMGLVSLGFGNWGKEKGGETTHKNVDGKIVPVDDDKVKKQDTDDKPEVEPKLTKIKQNQFDIEKKDDDIESDVKPKTTTEKITQNASDIFNDNVSGKGGGTTSLQEEIAGISRKLAIQQPNLNPDEHKEEIKQFIKNNYGNTKYGSKDLTKLIKASASGPESMRKIRANENMKFSDNQPEGFPAQVTFTEGGTAAVRNDLSLKLEEAKKSGDTEDISHYEKELEYFIKHATSETGVEGDGDTGMLYIDTDGRTRMIYISNKQSLSDPHANATVKSATEAIKASALPGSNVEVLNTRLDEAVRGGIDANGDMVKSFRADIDTNIEELNKAPLAKIGTKLTTGRAEFVDKTSMSYVKSAAKNSQVKEYIKNHEPPLDINNPDHVVQAAVAVAGSAEADGLNDSVKQAPNKLLFKMLNASLSIRNKMQGEINKGKTPEEAAVIIANRKNNKGKPLMGGNLLSEDCLSIFNNQTLEQLEQHIQTRKNAMQQAHENMHDTLVELDINHYQEVIGLSSDEARSKQKNEAGPNEQTYTKSFMKRMHWDRYVSGIDDDKKMIEIGDKAYSPKDFRDCLAERTNWNKQGSLQEHLLKNLRIIPGTMKLSFITQGTQVEIGDDTWRTAGDLSKIAGGLGTEMRDCLGSK